MPSVIEMVFEEQYSHLESIVKAQPEKWRLKRLSGPRFVLGILAKDQHWFELLADCDDFPLRPTAWHWYNSETERCDEARDTPKGSGFLHSSGRICAPWNRLAYQAVDPKGPHNDWQLQNWTTNSYTKGCTTLAAMALRLKVEMNSERYHGR